MGPPEGPSGPQKRCPELPTHTFVQKRFATFGMAGYDWLSSLQIVTSQ